MGLGMNPGDMNLGLGLGPVLGTAAEDIVPSVWPHNLGTDTPLRALKSHMCGRLVQIRGNVTRVSAIRPLALSCNFECDMCKHVRTISFSNGEYTQPWKCETGAEGCKSKTFTALATAEGLRTEDFQEVKVQESHDGDGDPGRIPRDIAIELRGGLVDCCVPGDVAAVVGIVETRQNDADARRAGARGGATGRAVAGGRVGAGAQSSLYTLYIHGLSVVQAGAAAAAAAAAKAEAARAAADEAMGTKTMTSVVVLDNGRGMAERKEKGTDASSSSSSSGLDDRRLSHETTGTRNGGGGLGGGVGVGYIGGLGDGQDRNDINLDGSEGGGGNRGTGGGGNRGPRDKLSATHFSDRDLRLVRKVVCDFPDPVCS